MLSGTDVNNYTLTDTTASTLADITAKNLTLTGVTASNKVYDGNTTASIDTSGAGYTGLIGGDTVTVDISGASGLFADKNAGLGKTVNISGLALGGVDAANYTLTGSGATITADITKAAISAISGITANNKIYDATTIASLNTGSAGFSGIISGDVLSVASSTGTFVNKNVGIGKTVNITGLSLGGTDAGNYTLADTTASTMANIVKAALTLTPNSQSYTYNGTASQFNNTAYTFSGFVGGENASVLGGTGLVTASDKINAGSRDITSSLNTLTSNNYSITATPRLNGLHINKKQLTVQAIDTNRLYGDANPAFTVNYTGLVNGETVSVLDTAPIVSTLATINSNTGLYDLVASAGQDNNYAFSYLNGTLGIAKATLTVEVDDKTRNQNTANPAFTYIISGFKNSDMETVISNLDITTPASSTSPAGSYAITARNAQAQNYSFNYRDGNLTIIAAVSPPPPNPASNPAPPIMPLPSTVEQVSQGITINKNPLFKTAYGLLSATNNTITTRYNTLQQNNLGIIPITNTPIVTNPETGNTSLISMQPDLAKLLGYEGEFLRY